MVMIPEQPIRLSDAQMSAIFAASYPLHANQRNSFLEACARELARLPEIGDGSVYKVVMEVQRRFFDPPDLRESGASRSRRRIADDEDDRPRRRAQPRTLGAL